MLTSNIYTQFVKPRPFSFVTYYQNLDARRRKTHNQNSHFNLTKAYSSGNLSEGAKKRLKKCINSQVLRDISYLKSNRKRYPHRTTFLTLITLTLSSKQIHCDKFIKANLLNTFLVNCRRMFPNLSYVWKAEVQKNGNLHFHILSNIRLQSWEVQLLWNRIQDYYGYLADFKLKYNRTNPPSTDINYLRKIKNVQAYLTEYMAKNEDIRPICGKNWGASTDLLNVSYNSEFLTGQIEEELWKLNSISKIIKVEDKAINIIIPDMEKFTAAEFPQLYRSMFEPLESIPIFSKYSSQYNNMITSIKNLEYINTQLKTTKKNCHASTKI
jgi:hypothetical protein